MRLKLRIGPKAKGLWSSSSQKGRTLSGGEDSAGQLDSKNTSPPGSKDEAFFDSQTWLDSDGEDDFVSVNGDPVSSRGGTPNNHQINTDGPLQVLDKISSNTSPESKSESSPTDGKRRLAELLRESQVEERNGSTGQVRVNGKLWTTDVATPKQDLNHPKERKMKAKRCCFPSLVHTFSSRESKGRKICS